MPAVDEPSKHLPLGKVLVGALVVPWWQRRAFLRVLIFPALAYLALRAALALSGSDLPHWSWVVTLPLYAMLFSVLAVRCHRLVLLAPASVPQASFSWSGRETRFAASVLMVWLAYWAAQFAVQVLAVTTLRAPPEQITVQLVKWLPTIVAGYVMARFSLVLPARALDRSVGLLWAWNASRGNGWRLAAVVLLLPWALGKLVDVMYRDDASEWEWLLLSGLDVALLPFQIAALSLAYRELAAGLPDQPLAAGAALRAWPRWAKVLATLAVTVVVAPTLLIGLKRPCEGQQLARERSPGGQHTLVLSQSICGDERDQLYLTLYESQGERRTGQVLFSRPQVIHSVRDDWRRDLAWRWVDSATIEIRYRQSSEAHFRWTDTSALGGVAVRYLPLEDAPAAAAR